MSSPAGTPQTPPGLPPGTAPTQGPYTTSGMVPGPLPGTELDPGAHDVSAWSFWSSADAKLPVGATLLPQPPGYAYPDSSPVRGIMPADLQDAATPAHHRGGRPAVDTSIMNDILAGFRQVMGDTRAPTGLGAPPE